MAPGIYGGNVPIHRQNRRFPKEHLQNIGKKLRVTWEDATNFEAVSVCQLLRSLPPLHDHLWFGGLAFVASQKGHQVLAAFLAAAVWLFIALNYLMWRWS